MDYKILNVFVILNRLTFLFLQKLSFLVSPFALVVMKNKFTNLCWSVDSLKHLK
jgi:hypothetical protein